jgi:hypothetical protein
MLTVKQYGKYLPANSQVNLLTVLVKIRALEEVVVYNIEDLKSHGDQKPEEIKPRETNPLNQTQLV